MNGKLQVLKLQILKGLTLTAIIISLISNSMAFGQSVIDLSGKWQFYLDPQKKGVTEQWYTKKLQDAIQLPGSLQEQGFGDDVRKRTAQHRNGEQACADHAGREQQIREVSRQRFQCFRSLFHRVDLMNPAAE